MFILNLCQKLFCIYSGVARGMIWCPPYSNICPVGKHLVDIWRIHTLRPVMIIFDGLKKKNENLCSPIWLSVRLACLQVIIDPLKIGYSGNSEWPWVIVFRFMLFWTLFRVKNWCNINIVMWYLELYSSHKNETDKIPTNWSKRKITLLWVAMTCQYRLVSGRLGSEVGRCAWVTGVLSELHIYIYIYII